MYGTMFGYGGAGGGLEDDCYGPDRCNWRDESYDVRRENPAQQLLETLLEECRAKEQQFPINLEIVPPEEHFTDAYWKGFQKYVTSKGCTA